LFRFFLLLQMKAIERVHRLINDYLVCE